MNVKVETDTLKNGSKKIESYFTEHDELFNKINSLSTEYCTSLANFKSALVNKFNEYNKHLIDKISKYLVSNEFKNTFLLNM